MSAIQELEELIKHSEVFRRTKTVSYDIFMNYLTRKVSEKTGRTKVSGGSIAKDCGIPNNVFSFNRKKTYYIARDKLSAIARTYNFDLYETVELFEYFGYCLNTCNEQDRELIGDREIPYDLKGKTGTEEFPDCIFDLIRSCEKFSLAGCREFYDENKDLINSGKTEEAYIEFTKWVERAGNEHLWRVQPDQDINPHHDRETLFEIGYLCAFSLEEIKRLYRSQGYLFAPQFIKFDAFVDFLFDYDEKRYDYAFYKSVCSDIDTRFEKYDRTEPDINVILHELGIIDDLHYHRSREPERDEH